MYQDWGTGTIQAQTVSPSESCYSVSCICSEDFASGGAESLWDSDDALAAESLSNERSRSEVL